MENFIRVKYEYYNPGRASQKVLRIVMPLRNQGIIKFVFCFFLFLFFFFETEGCTSNDVLLTVYIIQL